MSVVRILGVTQVGNQALRGGLIDKPSVGNRFQTHAVAIEGWVIGAEEAAETVEVLCGKTLVGVASINRERPDVAARFPGWKVGGRCGFRLAVSMLGLDHRSELAIRIVLKGDRRVSFASLEIERTPLALGPAGIEPLMVTTPGRTGSTWLTHLLGQHPGIITYRPFRYEARIANYWMSVLKSLSEPNSYLHAIATSLSDDHWWLGDRAPEAAFPLVDPAIEAWLGAGSIETLARYCRDLTSQFYQRAADLAGKKEPVYFVEKFSPGQRLQPFVGEIYPNAREIFLVRDFRDMLCSILAYNKKRRIEGFGRHLAKSDEEYVGQLRGWAVVLHKNWTSRSRSACLVLYENLVLEPAATLGRVFDYLELPSAPALVEQIIQRANSEKPDAQKAHQTSSAPAASIGRWRNELDSRMKAACGEAFDDILEEFGYEPVRSLAGGFKISRSTRRIEQGRALNIGEVPPSRPLRVANQSTKGPEPGTGRAGGRR